jgi:hypothetical protein
MPTNKAETAPHGGLPVMLALMMALFSLLRMTQICAM